MPISVNEELKSSADSVTSSVANLSEQSVSKVEINKTDAKPFKDLVKTSNNLTNELKKIESVLINDATNFSKLYEEFKASDRSIKAGFDKLNF